MEFRSDPWSSTIHYQLNDSVHGRVCMERERERLLKVLSKKCPSLVCHLIKKNEDLIGFFAMVLLEID